MISSGVTGKLGDMDGVWIAPVMAQVMMTLDMQNFLAARKTSRVTTAGMLQIRPLHDTRVNPWARAQMS